MGQWIGKGNWGFSYEEKRAYKEKKKAEYLHDLEIEKAKTRKYYINLTQLKSFLSNSDVKQYFPKPDREISMRFGPMKLYDFNKVVGIIKSNNLSIKIKKAFEEMHNEEFKTTIRCMSLDSKLDNKKEPAPRRTKI